VFVLEELLKRFDPRTTIATLVASASGFAAAHLLVRSRYDFDMKTLPDPRLVEYGWILGIGVVTGVLAVLYNGAVMAVLRRADASSWPKEARAAVTGALVGLLVWYAPDLVGSGDGLTQRALYGHGALLAAAGVFTLRFVLGVVSYAAATPGGLFAPMLVLGSQAGLIVGLVAVHLTPHAVPSLPACALIGMAAFFTASVHAPVTGLILATEMTGNTNQLPPMLGACAVAMLIAVALRSEPIYHRLSDRAASLSRPAT
jgi:chloride channel protein, CIC family